VITTGEARDAVLAAMPDFESEQVPTNSATDRILRQSIVAERDQPPFNRVMMDGIAIAFDDYGNGLREFPIQATQAAGDQQLSLEPGKCIEIMTGASLPVGADCIVPVERIAIAEDIATLEADYEPEERQFIHPRGSDHLKGAELLAAGKRVSALDIAIINSCGLTDVDVSKSPEIRVISTGNELVPAGEPIEPHQVRLSNGPAVIAMLEQHGYRNCQHDHLVDEPEVLKQRIAEHLDEADILILSGGVSMGKADYVPAVLKDLGVEVVFHKISQRPGKPMWFGMGPNGQAVFALPGNPVSTLVCCRQYVVPALARASGQRDKQPEFAALAQDVSFKPNLTCFMPVRLISNTGGQVLAMPVHTNTSGDFASLSGTDGYVELPLGESFMAELGLALAGFAGVGSAFGGRGRKYGEIDLIRLMVLFLSAGSVVAGSLAVLTIASYGLDHSTVYSIVSAGLALMIGLVGVPLLLAAHQTVKDPEIIAPIWIFAIGVLYFLAVEILFLHNAIVVRESGPLIAAFSISLVFGLWMFTRLMVRHNR
jgi:molybdopterin molybdotransferase